MTMKREENPLSKTAKAVLIGCHMATLKKCGHAPKPASCNGQHNLRDPCTQRIATLGPKVCKYYLHWATWILWVKMKACAVSHSAPSRVNPQPGALSKFKDVIVSPEASR